MKRLMSVLLIVCLLIPTTVMALAETEEKVTVTIMHYMAEDTKRAALDAWTQSVTEQYPNIVFDVQAVTPMSQYTSVLQTKIASGDAPDIMFGRPSQFSQLVSAGQIMDITDASFLQNFDKSVNDSLAVDGKYYCVPIDRSIAGVFYNKGIFEKCGISVPTTHSEFMNVIKTLEDNGYTPFVRGYKDNIYPRVDLNSHMDSIVAANDKNIYQAVMSGEKKITDYPFFKMGLEIFADRLAAKRDDDLGVDAVSANQLFASGAYPMMITGTWAIGSIRSNNPDGNFGFFTTPWSDQVDENTLPVGVDGAFMISAQTKNMEAITKFFDHVTSAEGVKQWADNANTFTVIPYDAPNLDGILKDMNAIIASGKVVSKDDYVIFSGEYKSKFEQNLQLFAGDPSMGVDAFLADLDETFGGIN